MPTFTIALYLALDPFLDRIKQNICTHSFNHVDKQLKYFVYVDGILLYICNPEISLPSFSKEVNSFLAPS